MSLLNILLLRVLEGSRVHPVTLLLLSDEDVVGHRRRLKQGLLLAVVVEREDLLGLLESLNGD
jgi:hypothetical protein